MVAKVVASEIVNKVTTEGINDSLYKLRRLEGQLNKVKKALQGTASGFKAQSRAVETNSKKIEHSIKRANDRIIKAQDKPVVNRKRGLDKGGIIRDRASEAKRIVGKGGLDPSVVSLYHKKIARLSNQFRQTDMSAREFNRGMRNINHELRQASRNTSTLSQKFNKLRTNMLAMTAAFSVGAAFGDVAQTGKRFESVDTMMGTVFGEDKVKEMKFLNEETNRLGLNTLDAAKGYAQFAFASKEAGIEVDQLREIFSGFSEAGVVFGITQDEMGGTFKALIQMVS